MAKKKKKSLWQQAQELGRSKYAPALADIANQLKSNQALYSSATRQRTGNLSREYGSISAAGATTQKQIGDLGTHSQSAYQEAMANSQKSTQDLLDKVGANNSNLLSSLQADMRARGLSNYADLSPLTQGMNTRNDMLAAMGKASEANIQDAKNMDLENTNRQKVMATMMKVTSQSGARGAATKDLQEMYNNYLQQRYGLEGKRTTTGLEEKDYINQTYLTLKDRAAQNKAAKASAAASAANAAANLAYKYEALKVNTQFKYDQLSSKTAQNDITNAFKEKGFAHKQAVDMARLALDKAKLAAKPGQQVDLADIIARMTE